MQDVSDNWNAKSKGFSWTLIKSNRRYLQDEYIPSPTVCWLFPSWIPVPEQSHRIMSIHQRERKFKQRENWITIWTHCIKISWLRVNKFTALFNNKKTLKFNGQLIIICFLLLSIIIMIASNGPWNTKTQKWIESNQSTNHKSWTFELVGSKVLFPKRNAKMIDDSEERKR